MDYWAETLQDDAWMVAADGWQALRPDDALKGLPNTDLIPPELVVARCFAADKTEVDRLEADRDAITRQIEELEEEYGGDEGLLAEARNEKGKITAKGVKDRLRAIKSDPTVSDEKQVLQQYAALADQEAAASKRAKDAQRELDAKVAATYTRMTQPEVQVFVVLDKWLATLTQRVQGELDRVSQQLTGRIKQLADRYATPLPQLAHQVDSLQAKVNEHLRKMGFAVSMHQLLTGEARLPGFSGEWEVKRLGDIGSCLRGVTYKADSDLLPYDTAQTKRLLRSNNVQDSAVIIEDLQFVNSNRVSPQQVLRPDDILICMANGSKALVGKAGLFKVNDGFDYTFGAFMGCFRTDRASAHPAFIFYLFQTARYKDYINNLLAGSSINNLSPANIESLEFSIPSQDEQEAISRVLSDMDAEIESLEARRKKTLALKQGMMQELLNGKIRSL